MIIKQYILIDTGLKKHLDRLYWKNRASLLRRILTYMKNHGGRGDRAPNILIRYAGWPA